jgi:hypothetical protein
MPSNVEHFCTLFDSKFLPFGLALRRSLEEHAAPYRLWVLCMDERVEADLRRLALPHLELIPLREAETPALRAVKAQRSPGEYCWTLTPFIFDAVFARAPEAGRVTYLDADLFFFDDPRRLLRELDEAGKTVLITDHAYDPEYDKSALSGRFCVQFNTFGRDGGSRAVLDWWQARCLDWCFDRHEDGKFGDQKYLDDWPSRFPAAVHVLRRSEATLAPWNVRSMHARHGDGLRPVFFHFHGFRPIARDRARMYMGYRVGAFGDRLYDRYLSAFAEAWARLRSAGIPTEVFPPKRYPLEPLREMVRLYVRRNRRYGGLPVAGQP